MKAKTIKKELIVFLACSLFLLSGFKTCKAIEIPDEEKWTDYDNYIVIDTDTTWSGQVVYDDPYKPVAIVNGATLTIEKGTTVQIMSLEVHMGRIVAEGTQSEKIKFTKSVPKLPEDYKPECLYIENGIKFYEKGWLDEYDVEPSIFQYVEFENMGSDYVINDEECVCPYTGGCQAMNNNIFHNLFKTAMAASYTKVESPVLNFESGNLRIENASFKNNFHADIEVNIMYEHEGYEDWRLSSLEVANSNFENNSLNTALVSNAEVYKKDYGLVHSDNLVRLINNWYGDASGPKSERYNSEGSGEILTGDYTLNGWSESKFEDVCADCASNVMFLPGIKASKLYKEGLLGAEDQLWPPNYFGSDIKDLMLDNEGKSQKDVYTNDVVRELGSWLAGPNIYKSFIENLDSLKNDGVINDYNLFAYDWRQSVEDVAGNGTPYQNDEIKSAIATLTSLAESSKSKKVTIVAHSNGGLLAKAMMIELENQGLLDKVDKIILVGSPQMGTPLSILSLLYGYDESSSLSVLISQSEARSLAEDMPGAYGLLPSEEYFDRIDDSFINFLSENTRYENFANAYGTKINDISEFRNFLLGKNDGREKPDKEDTDKENVLNENLLDEAIGMHQKLDAWTPPSNIKVIQIAGWGLDTISSVNYTEKEDVECGSKSDNGIEIIYCEKKGKFSPIYEPKFTVDGDAVVVVPSALMFSNNSNIERYWIDLYGYNHDYNFDKKHGNILESDNLLQFIFNIVKNEDYNASLPEYIKAERPKDYDNASPRIRMALYSPLDIHLRDENGNHTGPKTVTDEKGNQGIIFETGIPNSYYYQFGDRKYVGIPGGEKISLQMDGYDSGSYTLKMEEVKLTESGEEKVSETTFKNLPVSSETTVKLDIPESGLKNLSNLEADYNGDGENEYEITPVLNGEATLPDMVAPETKIEISGTTGSNDWYTSDALLTLKAEDNEGGTGIAETKYSLDNGKNWQNYSKPINISQEGINVVEYYSVDKQGNREETRTRTIKIDKTAPEAKLVFNSTTQKIDIIGKDNLSQNVTIQTSEQKIEDKNQNNEKKFSWWFFDRFLKNKTIRETAILADEAGHETKIVLDKKKERNGFIDLSLNSISYNGQEDQVEHNKLQYKWVLNWNRRKYIIFASHIKTQSSALEAHYFPAKNQTWIMEKPNELTDDEYDDNAQRRPVWKKLPGMVIPGIITNKGEIKINY